jgi:5'-nucleotidase/UDP-sugar diphosphatase
MKNTTFLQRFKSSSAIHKYIYGVFFVCGLFSFVVTSCKKTKVSQLQKQNTVTIKLIQVNDVYEIAPLGGGKYGGMARVAHISDSIKRQFPNSYLVMA